MAANLMNVVAADAKARADAVVWFKPIKDANLSYLTGTAVPQLTDAMADTDRSTQERLMIACALELVAAAIKERVASTL